MKDFTKFSSYLRKTCIWVFIDLVIKKKGVFKGTYHIWFKHGFAGTI